MIPLLAAPPCTVQLAQMEMFCEDLILGLAGTWSSAAERSACALDEMVRHVPAGLTDRRPCASTLVRVALAGMAERLEVAARHAGWRCRPRPHRSADEALLGALVARMRLVARNLG